MTIGRMARVAVSEVTKEGGEHEGDRGRSRMPIAALRSVLGERGADLPAVLLEGGVGGAGAWA